MMLVPSLAELVADLRAVPRERRELRVQQLLAGSVDEPVELQFRALLVTALREANVWPEKQACL